MSVDRSTLKIDPFADRNCVFRATKSIKRFGVPNANRFMFSETLTQALVPAEEGILSLHHRDEDPDRQACMSELLPYFFAYLTHELRSSPDTVQKYQNCMLRIVRIVGDIAPQRLRPEHVLLIKAYCASRNVGPSGTAGFMYALKCFLKFCRFTVGVETMDTRQIRAPRIPKREVLFLTPDEVRQFVAAIPIRKGPRSFNMRWLCFRTLVEVLLGTGVRISEALSLKRSGVNMQTGEATIIGKGNKQRTVFFSSRALNWVKEYINRRSDTNDALFLAAGDRPLQRQTAMIWFGRFRREAGIKKRVTAHILRHTVATTLLFNGCPIGHIKEILGHENLMTTCNFYLGADKRAAKEAHRKYLDYNTSPEAHS